MKQIFTFTFIFLSLSLFGQVPNTITPIDKAYGLSKFWEEANYNFVYFENVPHLNFDSLYKDYLPKVMASKNDYEYYRLLKRFCSSLKDGHTTIYYPKNISDMIYMPRIGITRLKDKLYITNAGKSYENLNLIGSEIIKVDGKNTDEYLKEEVYPYLGGCDHVVKIQAAKSMLTGLKGTNVKITIKKSNNDIKDITIERNGVEEDWIYKEEYTTKPTKSITYKELDNSIAYIGIPSFFYGGDSIYINFKNLLPKLMKQKGLILDLRGNVGGRGQVAYQIVQHFTDKPYMLTEIGSTRKHLPSHKAWGAYADSTSYAAKMIGYYPNMKDFLNYYRDNEWEYETQDTIFTDNTTEKLLMPLVILTDANSSSATEDFLICLDYVKRGTRIGQKTSGTTGQQIYFEMPDGGRCQICARKCTLPDGRKFVGIGIVPNIEVEPTLNDYLSKKDLVMIKATEYLKKEIKTKNN